MKRERVASAGRCMMKDKTTETVDMKGYRDRCMKEWMKAGKKLLLDGPTNNNQNEQYCRYMQSSSGARWLSGR
jgi:hypothetical protein